MPGRGGGDRLRGRRPRPAARRACAPRGSAGGPVWSGGLTTTRRSKRPGRSSAESSISGRLVAAMHDHALRAGEAVHLGQDLVQRLLALVVAAEADAAAAGAADGVELVDEDDRRRGRLGLGEEVAHAARADADDHLDELRGREREERHVGLARDGPGEQRLAGARRPREQHAAGDRARRASCSGPGLRRKSTTSTSSSSASSMPATSSNVVRSVVCRVVALGARAAEAAQRRHPPAAACAPAREQHEQADEQDRRAEAEEERLPQRLALVDRLGVDHDVLLQQQVDQPIVGERRPLGLEVGRGRAVDALGRRGLLLEVALDRVARRRDLGDVALADLGAEEAVGHLEPLRAGRRLARDDVVHRKQDEQDDPEAVAAGHRGHAATESLRWIPALLGARCCRCVRHRARV